MRTDNIDGRLFILTSYDQVDQILQSYAAVSDYNPARFFKTAQGCYGQHDRFVGIKVPTLRQIAKFCQRLPMADVVQLLQSTYHEYRLIALFVLVGHYQRRGSDKQAIFDLYITHLDHVNNWDLVDSSAHHILGAHLYAALADETILSDFIISNNLWYRRIAMVSMWFYIRKKSYDLPLLVAKGLLSDKHDLIHKAVGWMLRELGKRDEAVSRDFLQKHGACMPRTMYRYATERLINI